MSVYNLLLETFIHLYFVELSLYFDSWIIVFGLYPLHMADQSKLDFEAKKLQSYVKEQSLLISEKGALADKISPGVLKALVTLTDKPKWFCPSILPCLLQYEWGCVHSGSLLLILMEVLKTTQVHFFFTCHCIDYSFNCVCWGSIRIDHISKSCVCDSFEFYIQIQIYLGASSSSM